MEGEPLSLSEQRRKGGCWEHWCNGPGAKLEEDLEGEAPWVLLAAGSALGQPQG